MGNSSGRRRGSGQGKSTLTWQDSMEEADWTTLSSSSAPLSSPGSPASPTSPTSLAPLPPVEHLIPLEAAILVAAHPHRAALTIAPPPGLLDLGWQAVRLHALRPKLLAFCAQLAEQQQQQQQQQRRRRHSASRLTAPFTPPNFKTPCTTPAPPVMPTIRQLRAAGRHDLIADISAAGGQLAVAQALGFAARRRPTGFWEDLGNVDEEIEAFVSRFWVVECGATESRQEEAEGGKGEGTTESLYLGRVRLRNFLSGEVLSAVLRDEEAVRAAMAAAAAAARAVALALAASRARCSAAAEGDESGGGTDAADDHSSGGDGSAVTGDTAAGETAEPSFSELLQRATRWPSDAAATAFTSSGSSSSSSISESTGSIGWEAEGSFSSGSGGSSRSVFDDGQGLVVASAEGSAVMPRVRDVVGAGRYDLHHAIVLHGGYRLVARELGRESGCWGGLESVAVRWEGGGNGSDESGNAESSNGGSSSGGNGRLRRRVGRGARQQMLEATAGRVRALMLTHSLSTFPTSSQILALAAPPATPTTQSEERGSRNSPRVTPHASAWEGEQLVASERRCGGMEECASASASAMPQGPAGAWEGEQLVAAVRRSGGPGAVADYLGVRLSKRGRGHWADEHVAAAAVRSFLLRHWGLLPPSLQPPSPQLLTPHPSHQPSSQPLTPPQPAHSPLPPLAPPDPLLEWDEEEERAVWEEAVRGGVVERQGRGFPTDVQLVAAGRLDVRYILRKFGREAIAQALGPSPVAVKATAEELAAPSLPQAAPPASLSAPSSLPPPSAPSSLPAPPAVASAPLPAAAPSLPQGSAPALLPAPQPSDGDKSAGPSPVAVKATAEELAAPSLPQAAPPASFPVPAPLPLPTGPSPLPAPLAVASASLPMAAPSLPQPSTAASLPAPTFLAPPSAPSLLPAPAAGLSAPPPKAPPSLPPIPAPASLPVPLAKEETADGSETAEREKIGNGANWEERRLLRGVRRS
ncbi:unnamed protein product [Closterium sp. NIES-64]|nr:unnamed protein product [Closterium sp. NIES-64]